MKAVEFVKKFGWDEARKVSNKTTDIFSVCTLSFYNDVKQLVKAKELVDKVCQNMTEAKYILGMLEKNKIPHMTLGSEFKGRPIEIRILTVDFKKAIQLVESVNA